MELTKAARKMMAFQIALLLVLMCVCSVAPGFFLVRRLRWSPLEKFCGAVGLSLVLLYLTAFATRILGLDRWAYYAVSLGCVVLAAVARRDLARLFRASSVRRAAIWFAFLWAWTFALMLLIRNYSGGGWGADWLEHYERVGFFLGNYPQGATFGGLYTLPARPPMMNALAAHFLGQVGTLRFETYQVVFAFFSLLAFLPCCLMLDALAHRGRKQLLVLGVLFALNPVFVENVTYPWTKLLAGFYVVLSVWFYLAALRKDDPGRMTAAFLAISAGFLVHYSAGPYALFLGLHYILRAWWRRPGKYKELALVGGLCAILLATWFVWSIATYGLKTTVASNTAVTDAERLSGEGNVSKVFHNIVNTIVPHPLRGAWTVFAERAGQQSGLGEIRDYMFLIYQVNVVFAMGLAGGPLVIYSLFRAWSGRRGTRRRSLVHGGDGGPSAELPERAFWFFFVAFCTLVGVAVHGAYDHFGVAHICHQPLVLLGLAFLAGNLNRLSVLLRWAAVLGLRMDFYLGILLQHCLEHSVFVTSVRDGRLRATVLDGPAPGIPAVVNWQHKTQFGLTYLGDAVGGYWLAVLVVVVLVFEVLMGRLLCRLVCQASGDSSRRLAPPPGRKRVKAYRNHRR